VSLQTHLEDAGKKGSADRAETRRYELAAREDDHEQAKRENKRHDELSQPCEIVKGAGVWEELNRIAGSCKNDLLRQRASRGCYPG